jgi:tetratricopeptide (TPR) repeat protein
MRHAVLIILLLAACAASPALAGISVIGNTLGRECYEQTLGESTPVRNLQALAVCNRAVEDFTVSIHDRTAAFVNRADILLRMQRFREAVADSEKAISFDPAISVAHLNRGAGMIGLERYGEALAPLDRAIELGVDRLQLAYFDRGLAKDYMGDASGAYYDYRKAVELDPGFTLASQQLSRFTVQKR